MNNQPSTRFSLNIVDWKSMGMGLLKTLIGAALTYLMANVYPYINWGVYGPIAVPVLTFVVNFVWKWVDGPSK